VIIEHTILRDCSSMTAAACSDAVLVALGHGPEFALMAVNPDSTVHGSVSIVHASPPEQHEITVTLYDFDEAPDTQIVSGILVGRRTTLKCADDCPTAQTIHDRLDSLEE